MYQSNDFKGYELANGTNDCEDKVSIGSLNYLSTKFEVFIIKYFNICNIMIKHM